LVLHAAALVPDLRQAAAQPAGAAVASVAGAVLTGGSTVGGAAVGGVIDNQVGPNKKQSGFRRRMPVA
jgi:hypothetical protein